LINIFLRYVNWVVINLNHLAEMDFP